MSSINIKNTRNDGFTLIELVIVMLIIGIISVVSYPRFTNTIQSMNLRVATDKLTDDLRYVYNYAVTNHQNTWFSINIGNNSYSYGVYNTPPSSDPVVLTDPATNQPAIINLNDYNSVTITAETLGGGFDYNWWGTPSTGGQITLNGTRTIVVESETGYVYEL
jgi:prepilin-type N-terminal cleavage/methylation domain-containing protein